MGKHPVLLADDDKALRETLGELFSRMGFHILEAGDGISALRLARSEAPSFSLLDFHMPGLSGLEVIKALRNDRLIGEHSGRRPRGSGQRTTQTGGRLPCILMSADASQNELAEALGEGAFCVLQKPLNIESLFRSVTELMQHFTLETDRHVFESFSFSFEFQCETLITDSDIESECKGIVGPIHDDGCLLPAPLSSQQLFFKRLEQWFLSLTSDKGENSGSDERQSKS